MRWDWGRPFGGEPGENRRIGKWIISGWFVLGLTALLFAITWLRAWILWVMGIGFVLLGVIAMGMAAGVIPRRGRD
jgi:hypothetical protein